MANSDNQPKRYPPMLKDLTDISALWATAKGLEGSAAMRSTNVAIRTAASYAVRAVETRIGTLMAEGLPPPPPKEVDVSAEQISVTGASIGAVAVLDVLGGPNQLVAVEPPMPPVVVAEAAA